MPERTATLPNGKILHFPDGTSDEVIQKAVKATLGIKSEEVVPSLLPSHDKEKPNFKRQTNTSPLQDQLELQHKGPYEQNASQDIFDILSNSVPNIRNTASLASGAAAGVVSGSPLIGDMTMGAIDEFLRSYTGEPSATILSQNETLPPKMIEGSVESGLVNKFIAGGASKILGGAKELLHPRSVINDEILDLKPTFAQLLRSRDSRWAGIAEGFENLFAPSDKTRALNRSFNLAKDEGDAWLQGITGRNKLTTGQSDQLAEAIKQGSLNQYNQLKIESNARGNLAKQVANSPVNEVTLASGKVLHGEVDYQDTMVSLQHLKDELNRSNLKPDPNNPIFKAISDLENSINAKFDPKGNLISYDKTDFGAAWIDKQIAGKLGYDIQNLPDNVKTAFKALNRSIDSDIQRSIPTWKNPQDALNLFNEANLIVSKRNDLFSPSKEVGKTIDDLINNSNAAKANFYHILDDPKKLDNFLLTNRIVIPDGQLQANGAAYTNIKYISSNAKRDAQGATIQRALNLGEVPNPQDNTKNYFDSSKMMGFMNDPERQDSLRKIFGSQNLSNVKQLFKNITLTSEKEGGKGATRYLGLKAGTYGISLGSGIATALTVGKISSGLVSGGLGVSVTLGSHAIAKAMINPEAARVLIALSQGAPLNMSVKMATRVLATSLRNQIVTITYDDGSSENMKINNLGQPVPLHREPQSQR